ncbi:MAG: response regulator [Rhodocyclaceae bacterium]|nr:response regulator [Rhodocyclaceae bacterium]
MPAHFGNLSTFLVEPSSAQARAILDELKSVGLDLVRVFADGHSALAAMREARPELVLSAYYLPDMTGAELVARMRKEPELADIAFILISSETRPQALEPIRQQGACGILPKPFSRAQLLTALETTLEFLRRDEELAGDAELEELTVLIVDDSASARRFIHRVLENLGIRKILEAVDGRAAAAILAETMVDLVITDYNMPEMDGKALIEHIRTQSWQSSVPILMVTSESDSGRLAAIEKAGVSGICDKPFEPGVVKALLRGILANR